jgi:hypothetical protein
VSVAQIGRLGPALAAISLWPQDQDSGPGVALWGFIAVPIFAVLASLAIIVMVRERRRSRRRRLRRAA